MDIPIFLLLAIFRPKGTKLLPPPWPNLAWLLVVFVPTIALMVAAPAAMVAFRPDCIKVEDKPDPSAALKLEVFKLKQELSTKQQEIADLKMAITELKQAPRLTAEKAIIGNLEITDISTISTNTYQIQFGGKQTLLVHTENPDEILLIIRDYEKQEFSIEDKTHVLMKWIEPEKIDDMPPITDANDTPPVVDQWDWLQYVVEDDVRQQISEGLVVVMMHRYDCPVCEDMGMPTRSRFCQFHPMARWTMCRMTRFAFRAN
jgi:hypothetical protein